jgi:mono/diheme cytochrome c family protein
MQRDVTSGWGTRRRTHGAIAGVFAVTTLAVVACSASSPTPPTATIPHPTATSVPVASPTRAEAASTAGTTAGDLASQGKTVFASNCAKCHGDQGQGVTAPALIGPNSDLVKYKTAKGVYDFASSNMPQDNPGSLSADQYLQVISYLMVQNGDVKPDAPMGIATLGSVTLKSGSK